MAFEASCIFSTWHLWKCSWCTGLSSSPDLRSTRLLLCKAVQGSIHIALRYPFTPISPSQAFSKKGHCTYCTKFNDKALYCITFPVNLIAKPTEECCMFHTALFCSLHEDLHWRVSRSGVADHHRLTFTPFHPLSSVAFPYIETTANRVLTHIDSRCLVTTIGLPLSSMVSFFCIHINVLIIIFIVFKNIWYGSERQRGKILRENLSDFEKDSSMSAQWNSLRKISILAWKPKVDILQFVENPTITISASQTNIGWGSLFCTMNESLLLYHSIALHH